MNRNEIQNTIRAELSGVSPEVARSEIELLKLDRAYQDQRTHFGAAGERARVVWDVLHEKAYPDVSK